MNWKPLAVLGAGVGGVWLARHRRRQRRAAGQDARWSMATDTVAPVAPASAERANAY